MLGANETNHFVLTENNLVCTELNSLNQRSLFTTLSFIIDFIQCSGSVLFKNTLIMFSDEGVDGFMPVLLLCLLLNSKVLGAPL